MKKPLELISPLTPSGDQPQAIKKTCQGLHDGLKMQNILGVTGSGKTFTVAQIIAETQRPALILAPNKTLAAQLYREMKRFFPRNACEYFVSYYDYYQPEAYVPTSDTFIEKDAAINQHIEQMRLSATKSLLQRQDSIIVASVSAIFGLGAPESYLDMRCQLQVDQTIDQHSIIERFVDIQYQRNDIKFERGNFRVRGDVIDVFPAESFDHALRITLFDDQIESLSLIDPLTGKSLTSLASYTLFPRTHYVTPADRVKRAVAAIKDELGAHLKTLYDDGHIESASRLERRCNHDIEKLEQFGSCNGIENYSRHLSNRQAGQPPPTLLDYLDENAIVFIDESHVTIPQLGAMYKGDHARKSTLIEYGFRLPSALDNRPLKFEEFEAYPLQMVCISATPGPYELENSSQSIEMVVRPTGLLDPIIEVRPVKDQVDDLMSEINACIQKKQRVLVTCLTKKMSEDLSDYFAEHGIKVSYLHASVDTVERIEILDQLRQGIIDVIVGINLLREGLDLPEVALVAILDADKEGFLRNERSLIQTIGRAARNNEGKAILYADTITRSMQAAIDETQRRRDIQQAYNLEHNITPLTITKAQDQALVKSETTDTPDTNCPPSKPQSAHAILTQMAKLDSAMHEAADALDFETAAQIRDQIKTLENQLKT